MKNETAVEKETEFVKACEEYSDALFRYCFFKINDREVAKDLVQETFVKAWTYIAKGGDDIKNMRAFFYKILGNLIIDEYRKKKSVSLDALAESGFEPVFANENIEDKIDGGIALSMLGKIPEMYRDVIYMRFVEDLSIKEIALLSKESENSVSVRLHRGLKKVARIFNGE